MLSNIIKSLHLRSFLFYIDIFIKGYTAYHYMGYVIPLARIRQIYATIAEKYEFVIAWDMYYLELTLSTAKYRLLAKTVLVIRENIANILYVFRNSAWRYYIQNKSYSEKYEVFFCDNGRPDLAPFMGFPELSVHRQNCSRYLPTINPCALTFAGLFAKRIQLIKEKFKLCKLPDVIVIEEGQSVEQRALYLHAVENNTRVEFSWRRGSSQVYSPEELQEKGSLRYPGILHRPAYSPVTIVPMKDPILVNLPALVVVPTFNDPVEVVHWIECATARIIAPNYKLSIHPSYNFLKPIINSSMMFEIDDDKLSYCTKYEIFIGCYSTLLQTASDKGKKVFSVAFSHKQLEGICATHNGMTVYDAT